MKKLLTAICLFAFVCAFGPPASAQVLWRSAKTMKAGTYIAMTNLYYQSYSQIWDTANDEWIDYGDTTKYEWGFNSMIGYAPTDRVEIMAHIPFRNIKYEPANGTEQEAMGIGDIWLKTRIAVIPWTKDKHGLCLIGTVSLPTGNVLEGGSQVKLGSGRVKFGLGGIFSTKWFGGKYRGHFKLHYWFDQKGWFTGSATTSKEYVVVDGDTSTTRYVTDVTMKNKDVGDAMQIIIKNDWKFNKKLFAFGTYILNWKWKDRTAPGVIAANTHQIRHQIQVGLTYIPKAGLYVRPKVAIPVGGEVGLMYDFKPMIDVWYEFTI